MFLGLAKAQNLEISSLMMWYKLDSNADPPVYQLQPITTYFPQFTSAKTALKKQHDTLWWNAYDKLRNTIWQLVEIALKEQQMTSERAHAYRKSGQ